MGRTLLDLATRVADDVDEKTTDATVMEKIKRFINRYYKDVAKRQKYSEVKVTAVDGLFVKPEYYKIGVQLRYKESPIDFSEDGSNISCEQSGELTFVFEMDYEALLDLTDIQTPVTFVANDEVILSGAKYNYWKSENKYNKAEIEKRDYETAYIKRPIVKLVFKTYR
ncbi:MAG: hypothetical protein ABFD25_22740 [Clostridiaceae bacterium]